MRQLSMDQARELLRLAREKIGARLAERSLAAGMPPDPVFAENAATFVTLKIAGQLRGCIGTLEPLESLWESIGRNAENAAFRDSRFNPLSGEELEQVHIDISVLTRPQPLTYRDGEDLAAQLQPGVDGVILRRGRAGATFLPQVWEQLPTPELFLGQLCRKAGLAGNCWREEHPQIEIYQVQCFAEETR